MGTAARRHELQLLMTRHAGVVRTREGLLKGRRELEQLETSAEPTTAAEAELANLATVARAVLVAAELRTESRGSHVRAEFPDRDPDWERRLVHGRMA